MKAKLGLILVIVLVGASFFTMFASATHQNHTDGNDTKGKLDVRKVKTFGKLKEPGWRILTFGRLKPGKLRDRGFFLVNLDTFGDERFDYYALISSNGSKFQGELWRDPPQKRDRRVANLRVWRKSGDSVSVRIPLKHMNTGGPARLTYRWYVKTLFTGNVCKRVCFDRVPNSRSIDESNGKPVPTPTPTPTEDSGLTETPDATESPEATPTPEVTESPSESAGG